MIKHIVMWTLKEEAAGATAAENGVKVKEMLENLNGKIETLKHIEVSVDIFAAVPDCNVILYSEFETKEDLEAYQIHPLHQECVAFVKQVVSGRSVIDYVI
ncbi:Dabb family protein [Maridesulfovibrio hydrothermalis]|uniref:Stress responsive alpha-beta barrel domain protein n=1 Tax=Maridesulfovibrio hydrothermalis AM13 = DSM 14728 TaxID=1121451 RepID=L0RFE2_9BACT|nr:Dabb family protein [Maridesulfovibrio hydrothermalis]CCO24927.1 Stress responsive alpha-beta barrel domain protein [Maridesulfovibrio hydrothermalis AM13 = DSM 14728]